MLWDYVKHFNKEERWGSASSMNGLLVLLLDAVRDRIGCPIAIHCGYESEGHIENSEHKRGNAVDFHFDSELSLLAQAKCLEATLRKLQVYDRVGLGVYPDWNNPGFHLDVRGYYARWGRIGQMYVSWEDALMHAAGKVRYDKGHVEAVP